VITKPFTNSDDLQKPAPLLISMPISQRITDYYKRNNGDKGSIYSMAIIMITLKI
jgi:hypothetical protein